MNEINMKYKVRWKIWLYHFLEYEIGFLHKNNAFWVWVSLLIVQILYNNSKVTKLEIRGSEILCHKTKLTIP